MDMYSSTNTTSAWANMDFTHFQMRTYYTSSLLLLIVSIVAFRILTRPKTNAPFVDPPKFFDVTTTRQRLEAVKGARSLLQRAYKAFPGKSFRIMAEFAELIVLPAKLANEIRNDDRFDFSEFTRQATFPPDVLGLDPFQSNDRLLKAVVQQYLTKSLNRVTQPLNEETALAISDVLTEAKDWHTVNLRDAVLRLIARVSSRIFLGEELCRNEKWLTVTSEYTLAAFDSAEKMRVYPRPIRGLISRFHPGCRRAASLIRDARACMAPVLERRRREKASGNYVPYNDVIEWFEMAANGQQYDPVLVQLVLSAAAIHTSTDLLSQTIGDLAQNQDFIDPLRKEIMQCLSDGGWKKTTLYQMKLLDSCVKESQRMKPISLLGMHRLVGAPVTLSDGTFIPKGSLTAVSADRMWDPSVYENPLQWDGARSFNKRKQEGHENAAQLVTTGPDHLAFGHGQHACPGRFFAASEIKMTLAHLLMKYDVRLHDENPQVCYYGFTMSTDPLLKVDVRRRREEVDLGSF
ncbi:hypothetical protein EsDP_00002452 [Epichloe bromicola]|uniref:P450 monooxygenase n=1 Tax=Epichloe bromicola TaxID=79588 RepID=A0ABQ0CKU2_9HYPO